MDGTRGYYAKRVGKRKTPCETAYPHILSEVSHDVIYMWSLKHSTNDLSTKQKRSWTSQTHVCQGEGEGVGWIGDLGLVDENSCIWSGWAMSSCYIAQGTISNHL